ncbi:MAG TPA: hypothetical protein VHC90_09710 [Bryobacteraceae bacterium]|nr:hypothetical protein [Bryobacteraceae bacterium]
MSKRFEIVPVIVERKKIEAARPALRLMKRPPASAGAAVLKVRAA